MSWEVGDLALAVSAAKGVPNARNGPKIGSIHRVDGVVFCIETGLVFGGFPSSHFTKSWNARCFRKVVRDKIEPCEAEFVTLLKRAKRPVTA